MVAGAQEGWRGGAQVAPVDGQANNPEPTPASPSAALNLFVSYVGNRGDVIDGHPAHRAKIVAAYVQSLKGRLELHFLPGYAPDLTPNEFVWNHLRQNGVKKKATQEARAAQGAILTQQIECGEQHQFALHIDAVAAARSSPGRTACGSLSQLNPARTWGRG